MYVGHFMAWLAASMLFALQLHQTNPNAYTVSLLTQNGTEAFSYEAQEGLKHTLTAEQLRGSPMKPAMIRAALEREAAMKEQGKLADFKGALVAAGVIQDVKQAEVTNPGPLPGKLANAACGLAGLICVVIAGWTTANPTIYRAGLAFQAIMPKVSRFKVTLVTGAIATTAAVFPALAMKLLGFVALYGMVLMPMGAIIFVDFWLLKRLGLKPNYAEASGTLFYWVPLITWVTICSACGWLALSGRMEIYFVSLPGWFAAALLYVVLSKLVQKKEVPS
jgi:purine-cytosine permease-like protein